ncbi:MAG: glycerol-3-phosphate dehydrogenase/oxidase [Opitutaceae bacterium]|jgi:glycerol-3-phosphate dehydrogenase
MRREPMLDRLRGGEIFDVLIVGGGATGLGAAVEAAARGHRVALIERDDFAQGTSSRSTKLVHGGVRYLKQGNVSLVRDALRERGHLLRNAPHLTRNLAFVIPNYSRWDGVFYGVGLTMYDWLAGGLSLGASHRIGREETLRLLPTVEARGLVGGVVYHDGQFDDARLAINLAQTAIEQGAVLVNHCACTGFIKEGGRIAGVEARDVESGAEFTVRAKIVINATGVFVDALRQLDEAAARPMVTVSQGIHVVLPRSFMSGEAALMVPKTADGRVLFAVPWHDCVVVGTTDTPMERAVSEPRALDEERTFVMEHACKYLAKDPTDTDVLSVFAGLRPLVKTSGAGRTASLSRDHTIVVSAGGLVTITGGKWTTYRKMGEDVINRAEELAGLPPKPSTTTELKIHGWAEAMGHVGGYGSDETEILALAQTSPALAERVHPLLACTRAEVVWHARHEMARTVEDVLARRTRALLLNARASIETAPVVAELLANELGRDDAWRQAQVAAYTKLARGYVFTDPASRG